MKSIFLLCTLLAGVVNAHAEDVVYQWQKVTDLKDVATGDEVVIVDESKNLALPNTGSPFEGVSLTIRKDKLIGDIPTNIQWNLTKNDNGSFTFRHGDKLYGRYTAGVLMLTMNGGGEVTSEFYFDGYDSGGKLYYEDLGIGGSFCYVYWDTDNEAKITSYASNAAKLTLYKKVEAPKVVKWKLVDNDKVSLLGDDVVVLVDLTTGMAMSNDKADKDPDAVAVTLNYDKDRILGDVDEKLQWTYTATNGGFQFAATDGKLYADGEKLKVGDGTDNVFSTTTIDGVKYLNIHAGEKDYLAGVEESMFSNTWKLKELNEDGKPDDKVKDTRFAIFKKVEDYQSIPTLSFPSDNYEVNYNGTINNTHISCDEATCEEGYHIIYSGSNDNIAEPHFLTSLGMAYKELVLKNRGTIDLIARVAETADHDKAVIACTIRINDSRTDKGTKTNPLTPSEAIKLVKGELSGYTLEEGRCYFIKGKVNKVNSGMLAMFGDMGLDEMFEGMEGMDDMDDFDMSEMGDMMGGMDFMSMIPGFSKSDGLTYFISDDGSKDNRLKVVNGRGLVTLDPAEASLICQQATFEKLEDLSPGDDVLVYGPLELSEDKNLFASLGIGGSGTGTGGDSGPTVKVSELNYLHNIKRALQVPPYEGNEIPHMYVNTTKSLSENEDFFFKINKTDLLIPFTGNQQPAQVKSADEEIAKWVKIDETNENSDSLFTAVEEGKTKITVKVKVILQEKDPNNEDSKEKSYTMKRKFQLKVLPRDKEPEGKNVGEYVLVKNSSELEEGTRLLIIGTRTKTDTENNTETKTNYTLGANNSMMGGGKEGKKVDDEKITIKDDGRECIKYEDVPEGFQEIILEQAGDGWYLNVGEDENGDKLYLYASVKEKDNTSEGSQQGGGTQGGGGFNMDEMMEMFMPSSGLKVGTKTGTTSTVEGVDSLKAYITISNDIATIKYPAIAADDKNTIVLTSSFDIESMMNMFSSSENEEGGSGSSSSSSSDMGSFDMFMASFNTKKPADIDEKKAFLPRIFGFVQYDEYPVNVGTSEWITIVSDYDVTPDTDVEAYVVTSVIPDEEQSLATLKAVTSLKGGEPYLLHSAFGEHKMTRTSNVQAPKVNLLEVSEKETTGEKNNTSVYVLANKTKGVGFYRWIGGNLGSGRVYLPIEYDNPNEVHEFCTFFQGDGTNTAILTIDNKELPVGLYYDIQGRRILHPTNGIHVINGKKVLVK